MTILNEEHIKALKSLGESKTEYRDHYEPTLLEVFPNPQQDTEYVISIEAQEYSALCPKTGQPDFATILIDYSPDKYCVESKSLKLYLFSYRSTGIFHEAAVNQIAQDLFKIMRPNWIEVTGKFNPRGGIKIWPKVRLEANWNMPGEEDEPTR
jgi:7-cyano-7-deazaguanine reductase